VSFSIACEGMRTLIHAVLVVLVLLTLPASAQPDRPNFLLITCEDMGPDLGCWGAETAHTPNLDALAEEGIRFTSAYANAPVCSPARSAMLLGRYQTSFGSSNHRSRPPLEPGTRGYAGWLRDAGYFCTNHAKLDLNASNWREIEAATFDEGRGWWEDARAGRPFLAIRNLEVTHQSRTSVWPRERYEREIRDRLSPEERHDPADMAVPPYYPDTPAVRGELARYADCVTMMDRQVGELLERLERDGLADDTIVLFFSDHGAGHTWHKRSGFDRGARVPLIVRIPEKWAHLRTAPVGGVDPRVVSFIDIGPTLLAAAGEEIPEAMHGRNFLSNEPPHRYAFVARDRIDEELDHVRSVFDGQYAYVRFLNPHRPHWAPNGYASTSAVYGELVRFWQSGRLEEPARSYFAEPRPPEALFDLANDPHEVHNLAGDPAHADRLAAMRAALTTHMRRIGDLGLVPEAILEARANVEPMERLAHAGERMPLARIHATAMLVGMTDDDSVASLLAATRDQHEAVRYWAVTAMRSLPPGLPGVRDAMLAALDDPDPSVRTAAAGGCLARGFDRVRARSVLVGVIAEGSSHAVLEAARESQLAGIVDGEMIAAVRTAHERHAGYPLGEVLGAMERMASRGDATEGAGG
jgi:N-sulfoglucosamine sulfohydrolase